jgi:hypothetical protein
LLRAFLALLLATAAACAGAQELSLLAGTTSEIGGNEETYSWTLEYMHALGSYAAVSLGWLNEGHVPGHHRDGQCVQLWARGNPFGRRWWLSAGIGPYRYFDTAEAEQGASYNVSHGWGAVLSAESTWYTSSRWLFRLRASHIITQSEFDSTTLQFGVGYQLEAPEETGPVTQPLPQSRKTTNNEITVLLGTTIVNSYESEQELARSIEYRRGLSPHVDWTVAWIDEGDAQLVRRNGIATQLWLVRPFLAERLVLGFGAGAYIAVDKHRSHQAGEEGDEAISGIVTATASVRLSNRWTTRASWNRIVTDYSRDTDVLLFGVGYRF